MPRTETILRVFVASPRDLAEERETLESVIHELNVTWSRTVGIRLDLIKWETHTYPSVGIDAQAVINEHIADDYDIFIGLMWTRFGSPTGRAGSGTAEEFYRAYKKHQENTNQVRIMFYFKDAPMSLSELDPEQLILIRDFKKDLGEKGAYYWTFTSRDEFAQLVRIHLSRQVQEWGKAWGIEVQSVSSSIILKDDSSQFIEISEAINIEELEEEGFLDLIELGQESFETMTEALGRMTIALQDLGTRAQGGADELNKIQAEGNVDIKHAKRINNRVAEALNNFSALMEVDVPIFASSYSAGMEAYSHAITLSEDFGPQDKKDAKVAQYQIQELVSTVVDAKAQMVSFRNTIAGTPRATTLYNRARKRALSVLDKLDEEFTVALNLAGEVEKALARLSAE